MKNHFEVNWDVGCWGLRLIVERHFVDRLFTDGQLVEGQYIKVTKFEVYKLLHSRTKLCYPLKLSNHITEWHDATFLKGSIDILEEVQEESIRQWGFWQRVKHQLGCSALVMAGHLKIWNKQEAITKPAITEDILIHKSTTVVINYEQRIYFSLTFITSQKGMGLLFFVQNITCIIRT